MVTPPPTPPPTPPGRNAFPRSHRLTSRADFADTYAAQVRRPAGPLLVFARPNALGHARLGLSVGRRVGNAPTRVRIKRLLREAFRHDHHDWPHHDQSAAYDLIVVVRPHEPLSLAEYRRLLAEVLVKLDRDWRRRTERANDDAPKPGAPT